MTGIARIGLFASLPLMLLVEQASAAPTQKCQEAKLKAQGKLELCLKKNSAKVLGGKADASTDCQTKFQAALGKAEHIAVAAGTTACRYVDNGDGPVSDLNTGCSGKKRTIWTAPTTMLIRTTPKTYTRGVRATTRGMAPYTRTFWPS